MILPATFPAALLLMVVCMLCWGSWANSLKLAGRWRFEHLHYDFALGAAVCGLIAAFTLGTMNGQDLTFQDNFLIASTRKIAYGVGIGMLINAALMFLSAAVSVSGMSIAFPISMAVTLIIGGLWNFFPNAGADPLLLFGGILCLLLSLIVNSFAYSLHLDSQVPEKPLRPDPRTPGAPKPPRAGRGIILSIISGLVMGLSLPLLDDVRFGENGVSPYGLAMLAGIGIFFSTFLIAPFFLNFPVQGSPGEFRGYFKGAKKQHFWGIFAGIVWMSGMLCYLLALGTPNLRPGNSALNMGLVYASALIAALWGLLVWRDFKRASYRVNLMLLGMLILYAAGVALVIMGPVYRK